jgi:MFS family permease
LPLAREANGGYRATMRRLFPLCLAAFLNDAALYLVFAALPFRALELGAGPVALGLLPTLYAGAYMLSAATAGRLSDRYARLFLARLGCILFVGGVGILASAPSLPALFAAIPALGISLGLFWSPLQAALSDRAAPEHLPRALATFNVSWSLGKGAGLLLGGLLTDAMGARGALLVGALPALVAAFALPIGAEIVRGSGQPPRPVDPRSLVPLRIAWLTNALAFGLVGVVNVHAPSFLLDRGSGASEFGILTGSIFAVQTVTFLALSVRSPGRRAPFLALPLALAAVAILVGAPTFPIRLLAAIPFGIATGVAYEASLRASLARGEGRGKAAGLHESLLGAGSTSIPLLGGLAAAWSGSLAAPFALAAACLVIGLGLAAAKVRPAGAGT